MWLLTMTGAAGKLARLPLSLSEVDFEVGQKADAKYQATDALSRLRTGESDNKTLNDSILLIAIFDQG